MVDDMISLTLTRWKIDCSEQDRLFIAEARPDTNRICCLAIIVSAGTLIQLGLSLANQHAAF